MSQVECEHCHGDGTVTVNPAWPDPQGAFDAPCVPCGGAGVIEAPVEDMEALCV